MEGNMNDKLWFFHRGRYCWRGSNGMSGGLDIDYYEDRNLLMIENECEGYVHFECTPEEAEFIISKVVKVGGA